MKRQDDWSSLVDRLLAEVRGRPASPQRPSEDTAWSDLRGRLHRMARLLVDDENVDDVVQAVALKLQTADALARMRAARSPEGYAFVMVRHAAIDLERRRSHESGSLSLDSHDAPDPAPAQDLVLERRLRQDQLKLALDGLADSDRLLVRLRFWENLSIAQIAARLGMPYSTVAVRMFRLLRRLRSRLGLDG
jgi:RNA polymerase sigma-70 factor (ECF subfamily)